MNTVELLPLTWMVGPLCPRRTGPLAAPARNSESGALG